MVNKRVTTLLRGDEIRISEEMRAQTFWLLRKYTSLTYVKRTHELYAAFVAGYEEYVRQKSPSPWYRENMRILYAYLANLEKGIDEIIKGYKSGYGRVQQGYRFAEFLTSPRFDDNLGRHVPIGYRYEDPAVGLYAWADRAIKMSAKTALSLDAMWAFPRIFDDEFEPFDFPGALQPLPRRKGVVVSCGEEISTTGVWYPLDIKGGCPNYLIAGRPAPEVQRATKRLDDPPMPATKWTAPIPALTFYLYGAEPTRWELIWEDDRYKDGKVPPEESAYLDSATALPPWPARHEGPAGAEE